jgi:hypothetical protein
MSAPLRMPAFSLFPLPSNRSSDHPALSPSLPAAPRPRRSGIDAFTGPPPKTRQPVDADHVVVHRDVGRQELDAQLLGKRGYLAGTRDKDGSRRPAQPERSRGAPGGTALSVWPRCGPSRRNPAPGAASRGWQMTTNPRVEVVSSLTFLRDAECVGDALEEVRMPGEIVAGPHVDRTREAVVDSLLGTPSKGELCGALAACGFG